MGPGETLNVSHSTYSSIILTNIPRRFHSLYAGNGAEILRLDPQKSPSGSYNWFPAQAILFDSVLPVINSVDLSQPARPLGQQKPSGVAKFIMHICLPEGPG